MCVLIGDCYDSKGESTSQWSPFRRAAGPIQQQRQLQQNSGESVSMSGCHVEQ